MINRLIDEWQIPTTGLEEDDLSFHKEHYVSNIKRYLLLYILTHREFEEKLFPPRQGVSSSATKYNG